MKSDDLVMDHPTNTTQAGPMTTTSRPTTTNHPGSDVADQAREDARQLDRIRKALASRSFALLSTVSDAGFPHAAGVSYAVVGLDLYVHTMEASRKARNVAATGRAAVTVPVRRLPVGPPFTVQFQADARVLDLDDPEITELHAARKLKAVTSHHELEEPDSCFLKLTPRRRIHTFGIGVSTLKLARDPLHYGARSVDLPA